MRSSSVSSSANSSTFSIGTPDDNMERTSISSTPACSPLSVDEEYERAFKSRSFLDLWSNAQQHNTFSSRSSSSFFFFDKGSSSSCHEDDDEDQLVGQPCSYTVLDDFVLEPSPEALSRKRRRRRRRVDSLLMEYFELTQEACSACSELLAAIGAARRHHLTLRRLLSAAARDALAEHVRLDNPLWPGRLSIFHGVHHRCATRLAAAQRRLRRLARGTAAAALVAAIVAAVVFVGASPATVVRWASGKAGKRRAVDAAARGAYIVGRGMDTLSRMVRRAHDELEHGRHVARIAINSWSSELPLLQEVGREEAECEADLREQLEEMEEHVCLCLITINRSRRMVAHEMTRGLPSSPNNPSSAK